VHRLAFDRREPDDLWREDAVDDRDDRGLGLAVGERSRWCFSGTDEAVVGVHAHQDVLGGGDLAAGEAQWLAVRDGERYCFHLADLHRVPPFVRDRERISGG